MTQSQRQRREGGEERRCWNVQIRKNIKKVNAVWSCRGLFACSHAAAALMFKLMLWNIYLFSKTLDLWEWIGTKRGTVQRCNRNYFNEHLVLFSTNYSSTSGIVAHFPINDITISFDCTQMPVPCVFLRRFVSLARVLSSHSASLLGNIFLFKHRADQYFCEHQQVKSLLWNSLNKYLFYVQFRFLFFKCFDAFLRRVGLAAWSAKKCFVWLTQAVRDIAAK